MRESREGKSLEPEIIFWRNEMLRACRHCTKYVKLSFRIPHYITFTVNYTEFDRQKIHQHVGFENLNI